MISNTETVRATRDGGGGVKDRGKHMQQDVEREDLLVDDVGSVGQLAASR